MNNENLKKEQEVIKIKRAEQSSLVAKLEESLKKVNEHEIRSHFIPES